MTTIASDAFINWYTQLERKNSSSSSSMKTHLIFERQDGEYYTAHGDEAIHLADTFYKTRGILKYYGIITYI